MESIVYMWIPHSSSRERVCVSHTDHRSKHETRDDQVARLVGHACALDPSHGPPFRCAGAYNICSSQRGRRVLRYLTLRLQSAVDLWVTCDFVSLLLTVFDLQESLKVIRVTTFTS